MSFTAIKVPLSTVSAFPAPTMVIVRHVGCGG